MPATRILILTAAFGEGHNSAARNLALAFERLGVECRVVDPCRAATPHLTNFLCKLYRWVTTHAPHLWYRIYLSTDDMDFSRQRFGFMRKPEKLLAQLVTDYQPSAIVCTYPLYPYFLERILAPLAVKPPVFTVITDSIEINASWKKAPTTAWLVTDAFTREAMVREGMPQEKIIDTGFPVNPAFAELTSVDRQASVKPFRVLYFTTAKKPHVRRVSRALLQASPDVHLTIVLGKNVRLLYRRARSLQREFPGRVHLRGWTKRVPELLNSHHLVVGKAGGATVHEAIAAQCPMLVHHLVPGQEEGNLRLLERLGGGFLAETPEQIRAITADLLADQAAQWRGMKHKLAMYHRNAGCYHAARFVMGVVPADKQE
jgi:processive 1,2-diacylglycerol beta-glucosyltransferase